MLVDQINSDDVADPYRSNEAEEIVGCTSNQSAVVPPFELSQEGLNEFQKAQNTPQLSPVVLNNFDPIFQDIPRYEHDNGHLNLDYMDEGHVNYRYLDHGNMVHGQADHGHMDLRHTNHGQADHGHMDQEHMEHGHRVQGHTDQRHTDYEHVNYRHAVQEHIGHAKDRRNMDHEHMNQEYMDQPSLPWTRQEVLPSMNSRKIPLFTENFSVMMPTSPSSAEDYKIPEKKSNYLFSTETMPCHSNVPIQDRISGGAAPWNDRPKLLFSRDEFEMNDVFSKGESSIVEVDCANRCQPGRYATKRQHPAGQFSTLQAICNNNNKRRRLETAYQMQSPLPQSRPEVACVTPCVRLPVRAMKASERSQPMFRSNNYSFTDFNPGNFHQSK